MGQIVLKRAAFLAFSLLLISACAPAKPVEERYDNIIAVAWHEGKRFTLWIPDPQIPTKTLRIYIDVYGPGDGEVFTDVPEDKEIWARVIRNSNDHTFVWYAEIHIRSIKDLFGANSNHGKFGTGTTSFIDRK